MQSLFASNNLLDKKPHVPCCMVVSSKLTMLFPKQATTCDPNAMWSAHPLDSNPRVELLQHPQNGELNPLCVMHVSHWVNVEALWVIAFKLHVEATFAPDATQLFFLDEVLQTVGQVHAEVVLHAFVIMEIRTAAHHVHQQWLDEACHCLLSVLKASGQRDNVALWNAVWSCPNCLDHH